MNRLLLPLLAVLTTSACVTFDPVITRRAGIRRVASGRLATCLGLDRCQSYWPSQKVACLAENNEYCLSEGLEKNCGVDGLWTATYPCSSRTR